MSQTKIDFVQLVDYHTQARQRFLSTIKPQEKETR